MERWIAVRESETGLPNPVFHQGHLHGHDGIDAFTSSQQGYDTLYIGGIAAVLGIRRTVPRPISRRSRRGMNLRVAVVGHDSAGSIHAGVYDTEDRWVRISCGDNL
ncbi:MAG: hypothetical protein OXN84_01095 [Albidovulum sp.]|nr:hypothetical protein [Albidovulum sp.]